METHLKSKKRRKSWALSHKLSIEPNLPSEESTFNHGGELIAVWCCREGRHHFSDMTDDLWRDICEHSSARSMNDVQVHRVGRSRRFSEPLWSHRCDWSSSCQRKWGQHKYLYSPHSSVQIFFHQLMWMNLAIHLRIPTILNLIAIRSIPESTNLGFHP